MKQRYVQRRAAFYVTTSQE